MCLLTSTSLCLDKIPALEYNNIVSGNVGMADEQDSGSCERYAREGSSPFFCMTDSPVQRCAGFLLYSDSINSDINLRKTGLQFKWNCAILLFVGEKIIGQRKLKNSKRECWNWQTGKTKDLVGVCSCGFKSHLPQ